MCKREQSDEITSSLTLHTFDLQIQPFAVENNKFSTGMCFLHLPFRHSFMDQKCHVSGVDVSGLAVV